MTIFLEIAKEILQREVTTIRDASLSSDASYWNSALTFLGFGRKATLSSAKRDLLSTLGVKIKELEAGKDDAANYEALDNLLATCRRDGAGRSSAERLDEGSFGPALKEIEFLLESIYQQLTKLHLNDIPYDVDPLNTFRYYAALYYSEKIVEQHHLTLAGRLLDHPDITNNRELTDKKKAAIMDVIHACERDLETLDKEHPRYQETRANHVIDWIDKLRRTNTELCVERSGYFFKPKPGLLDEVARDAIVEIRQEQKSGGRAQEHKEQAKVGP